MKEYFIVLSLGISLFLIAISVFDKSVYSAPILITISLVSIVYSLIKLSNKSESIKTFLSSLLDLI